MLNHLNHPKCIVIIPARYGSTRLPAKPLVNIAGKPLIQHVYERVSQCQCVEKTIVATDDQRIVDLCESFAATTVLTDESLASGTDRVAQAAARLNMDDDQIVMNVQGDQPLIPIHIISALCQAFNDDTIQDCMVTPITDLPTEAIHNPMIVKTAITGSHRALYFSRSAIPFGRDDWSHPMYKHIGVYAYRHRFLKKFTGWAEGQLEQAEKLEMLRVLENDHDIRVVKTHGDSPEVDVQEDVSKIEQLLAVRTTPDS